MERVVLTRHEQGDQGTFGRIETPNGLSLFTGELPWRDNRRGISCIPVGFYRVGWVFAEKWRGGQWVYLVLGTEPRNGILMHSANYMGDVALGYRSHLQGCIGLSEQLGTLEGQKALLLSVPAVRRFEAALQRKPFDLEIRNA